MVTTMTNAVIDTQHFFATRQPLLCELDLKTLEEFKTAMRTLADRIFIRKELESLEVLDEYMAAFSI